jgi:RimJ/RimL family protein N-acetyltransferase
MPNWTACEPPARTPMEGRYCRLEPMDVELHAESLFEAFRSDRENRMWAYLAYGPFETLEELKSHLRENCLGEDPLFFAILDRSSGRAVGMGSFMRIVPEHGVMEVGALTYSPALQRTPVSTEAMYLMMKRTFDELGYRRYEWKCDNLNEPSRRAAERLGFRFEGVFRQAVTYKGRNRDTAWFSVLDAEWPDLKRAFERWLDPSNFDEGGTQVRSLASLRQ